MFLILRGEIEGRLDVYYNFIKKKKPLNYRFKTKPLISLVRTFCGGTPDKSKPNYWNGDISWVSPKDMKGFEIYDSEDTITAEGLNNSSSKLVEINSILVVVRSGILQHTLPVLINKNKVAINQDIKALVIKTDEVEPYYLAHFLKVFQDYILPLVVKHSTTVQSVNTFEFDNLKIPIPPLDIQRQIISILENAYATQKRNKADAETLLSRIDDYLLDALGIVLPDTSNQKNTFFKRQSDIFKGRLDPFYHQIEFELYAQNLLSGEYEVKKLNQLCTKITDGTHYTPEYVDEGVAFVSVKDVRKAKISFENTKFISELAHKELIKRCKPQINDVLLTKIGTIGLAAVVEPEMPEFSLFVSVCLLKLKNELVNPHFIAEYLSSSLAYKQYIRFTKGIGVPDLHLENIQQVLIPLPPLSIQEEIAAHITAIREKAQVLEVETKTIIEAAKQEVERMILGD